MLERREEIDGLTGAYKKDPFKRRLHQEISRASRAHGRISVLLFDLDDFKTINDNNGGHAAGDAVLEEVGGFVREQIRDEDVFGRIGGDEFALILPATDKEGTAKVIKKLQEGMLSMNKRVATKGFPIRQPITMSIGETEYDFSPRVRETDPKIDADRLAEDLMREADEKLYEKKHARE